VFSIDACGAADGQANGVHGDWVRARQV
jgi:hypothetical protein